MPRQGFRSTGGRPAITPKTQPGYTPNEITAMSKLSYIGGDRTGNDFTGDPNHVSLCRGCGRPISSAGPFDRPDDNYDYGMQVKQEMHFTCGMKLVKQREEEEKVRLANLTPEQKQQQEDLEAANFEKNSTLINTKALAHPDPYQFSSGERPIEKGLTPDLPKKFEFKEENDKNIISKAKTREEQERIEFEEYQKNIKVD